jgi:uncharacterized protein
MNLPHAATHPQDRSTWWHHRMMWLVLGGPAVVVVAAIATAVIAVRGADVVLHVDDVPDRAAVPAMQARNHAATPVMPAAAATAKP